MDNIYIKVSYLHTDKDGKQYHILVDFTEPNERYFIVDLMEVESNEAHVDHIESNLENLTQEIFGVTTEEKRMQFLDEALKLREHLLTDLSSDLMDFDTVAILLQQAINNEFMGSLDSFNVTISDIVGTPYGDDLLLFVNSDSIDDFYDEIRWSVGLAALGDRVLERSFDYEQYGTDLIANELHLELTVNRMYDELDSWGIPRDHSIIEDAVRNYDFDMLLDPADNPDINPNPLNEESDYDDIADYIEEPDTNDSDYAIDLDDAETIRTILEEIYGLIFESTETDFAEFYIHEQYGDLSYVPEDVLDMYIIKSDLAYELEDYYQYVSIPDLNIHAWVK